MGTPIGSFDSQSHWARFVWVDARIREGQYPSIGQIQEEFGVARRTAFNTVEFLRGSAGAPIEYDRKRKGYYYTDPTFALPAVLLREGELLAILLAERLSRHYLGTPLEAPLRAAIGKILRYLPDGVQVTGEALQQAFHFAGDATLETPLTVMADVQRALRERRVMRLRYYTASRDEVTERDVEPHFLQNHRGDWMLVAWDRLRDADRVFMLARIQEHEVSEERFARREDLRPGAYGEDVFLTEHGSVTQHVAIRFDAYQARWIRERKWHPSQQIREMPDGGLILSLQVSGEGDLLRWVLGYGPHAEVLEPASLRKRAAEQLRLAAGIYDP